ncbi:gamma-glutamyltransferase [Parahaliea maris]|uniref:Glutathione hydrolase proenzyme n=1 Tax=Parahaliea maris TaxID=2716870 RepID=A0A5C8ZZ96_9GAMM|nr:gamma-glutamyltransferase [Parahaliea maris]TXS92717.1 gamma-glutamyltransferase [Parahaliea maris]
MPLTQRLFVRYFTTALLLAVLLPCWAVSARAGTAAVASPEPHATAAAVAVLEEGGNAVDAAIATAFVLAVTYPEAGNIGGGGFMLSYMDGSSDFLDFREKAPALASRDMYLNDSGEVHPTASLFGGKASGVPGTVAGMRAAHERYGSLPWKRLLQPAIDLAYRGFVVPERLAELADEAAVEFGQHSNFSSWFGAMKAGERFPQPDLATTLMRLAQDPDDFYRGVTAKKIVRTMKATGGLITAADLARYEPVWRRPLSAQWRDYEVVTAPPPSSGGVALLQLLHMHDLAGAHFEGLPHNSPRYVHLLAELEKRMFADRAEYLGDPDFVDVPVQELLAPDYLARRAKEIRPDSISPATAIEPGLESTETTHFSILDGDGNAVSLTYTLNWDFGSGTVIEGAGFLMNNEMDDFSAKAGVPNAFGVVGSDRNAIAPGKRMLSSMTPTLLLRDGQVALVVGSPGGSTIFTTVFQVLLNLEDYAMPLQEAVDVTRFHHQLPEATLIRHDQRDIPAANRKALEAMGYTVEPNSWGNLGDVQAIQVRQGTVSAAADSRGRGTAEVIAPD